MDKLKGSEYTTIRIPKALRDQLQKAGHKGETYADVIQMLVEAYAGKKAERG